MTRIYLKAFGLTVLLVIIIGIIIVLGGGPSDEPSDRNEYVSERNRKICKYDAREIRISTPEGSEIAFKKMGNIWNVSDLSKGELSSEFVKSQVEEFCDLKINEEADLDKLKGELEWIEDIEVVFVDGSSIKAKLAKNGVIQVGIRYYFAPSLLKLILGSEDEIPEVNLE